MIRKTLIPNSQTVSVTIPKNYIGKELEVIVFPKDEPVNGEKIMVKKTSFNALSIDTKAFKFNRDEANER